jgi:hypothetical protein
VCVWVCVCVCVCVCMCVCVSATEQVRRPIKVLACSSELDQEVA